MNFHDFFDQKNLISKVSKSHKGLKNVINERFRSLSRIKNFSGDNSYVVLGSYDFIKNISRKIMKNHDFFMLFLSKKVYVKNVKKLSRPQKRCKSTL